MVEDDDDFVPGSLFALRAKIGVGEGQGSEKNSPSAIRGAAEGYLARAEKNLSVKPPGEHRLVTGSKLIPKKQSHEPLSAEKAGIGSSDRKRPSNTAASSVGEPGWKKPLKTKTTEPAELSAAMAGAGTSSKATNLGAMSKASTSAQVKKQRIVKEVDFSSLFEGVTIVLSGFQNPLRGQLRDKAVKMGAKYKPDWVKGATHLICAFANTPKFNQVKGKGKITGSKWILESYKQRKRLSWRE